MAQSAHHPPTPQGTVYNQLTGSRLRRLQHPHPLPHGRPVAFARRTCPSLPAIQQPSACPVETTLHDQMLALLPNLRAFAFSLTNDPTRVDDLVQDTFLRAWANIDRFERGSNLGAWLFTIQRHAFYTEYRKRRHEVEDPSGIHAARLKVLPEQEMALAMTEFRLALAHLPPRHREALLLVGVEGMTYGEVAAIQGVAEGTIKSRVSRARHQLTLSLQMKSRHEIGPDQVMQAAVQEPIAVFP